MKDSFRKICPSCKAPNFYFREYCIMCDVALDRSGRVRPEPKIHNESSTDPKVSRSPESSVPNVTPVPAADKSRFKAYWETQKIQDSDKREQSPAWSLGHLLGQIALLALIVWALFALPVGGILILMAVGVLFLRPVRAILIYFISRRTFMMILIPLFLVAGGAYFFFNGHLGGREARTSSSDNELGGNQLPFMRNASSEGAEENPSWDGPFYFIQEFSWPNTEGIRYVWPMPTRAACEEFLDKNKANQMPGLRSVEKCIVDKGQYDGFFRHERNQDWYATFQASGKVANFGIFKLSKNMQQLGGKSAFHPIWLFVKSMMTVSQNQNPPITLTARIISPQGEVDMDTGQLKS